MSFRLFSRGAPFRFLSLPLRLIPFSHSPSGMVCAIQVQPCPSYLLGFVQFEWGTAILDCFGDRARVPSERLRSPSLIFRWTAQPFVRVLWSLVKDFRSLEGFVTYFKSSMFCLSASMFYCGGVMQSSFSFSAVNPWFPIVCRGFCRPCRAEGP